MKILNNWKAAVFVWSSVILLGFASGTWSHFLGDHINVSEAGAAEDDVLTYDAVKKAWKAEPATGVDLSGTSDEQVLFNDAGAIGGASTLTYDGVDLKISGALNPTLLVERTGTGAAWVEMKNDNNLWGFYANGDNFGIEPQTINGEFFIRNLANSNLFSMNTTNGLITIESSAQLRLTGVDGTATGLTGLDGSNDMNRVEIGVGLALTAGTLSVDAIASEIPILDAGAYYTGTETEAVLQEIGSSFTDINNLGNVDITTPSDGQFIQYQSLTSTWDNVSISTTDDQTASEVNISDAGGHYTATEVEAALQELGFESFFPSDAGTQAITKKENFIVIQDLNGSTQTQTITNTATTNGTRLFIKSDAATSVTFTSGSFIPLGSVTSSTTFVISGIGEAEFMFSGGTWWQIN